MLHEPSLLNPGMHDPAMLAQEVMERAYNLDMKVACAECFLGGSIAGKLASVERRRGQFAGAFILNCEEAIARIVGDEPKRALDASQLALPIARHALRETGAAIALCVVGPAGALRFGSTFLAVANDCGRHWEDAIINGLSEREIIACSLKFLGTCLERSDKAHF